MNFSTTLMVYNIVKREINYRPIIGILFFIFSHVTTASHILGQITLATDGKSNYSIIIPAGTSKSVEAAATDFVDMFQRSTGVILPIIVDEEYQDTTYFISLGNTKQARKSNIDIEYLSYDGFLIRSSKGSLFIIGKDTPNGETTEGGGISNGTANGVYSFLEDYLDARWLMPGELGKTVTKHNTLTIDDINQMENPLFVSRKLPYLNASWDMNNTSTSVNEWERRQKLGFSINLWHSHNWQQTVSDTLWDDHPEWFAMIDGKRPKPGFRYKLETTNPDLINYFATRAIETLKDSSITRTYSLSPSDSKGWSESPESMALYDPPQEGSSQPGMSSLVLKFYHDVAEIVQREYPEGKLAGYLYDSYLYPPTKVDMKLPNNFIPVIAPSSITYGFRLYNNKNKRNWKYIMTSWAKVAPDIWSYYDIPNAFNLWRITADYDRITGATGIITPPAPEILNFIFSGLVENNVKGGYLFGTPTWSNTAIANYILAKMMWNPQLDAYDVQRDWLFNAYGVEAGREMEKFYNKLENIYREYSKDKIINSRPNDNMFEELYGKHYQEIEDILLKALSKKMTLEQQTRLEMIENNMAVLQWRLKNAGFLHKDYSSQLQRSTAQISELLVKQDNAFPYFPEALLGWRQRDFNSFEDIKFKIATSLPERNDSTLWLQDKNLIILHSTSDESVKINTHEVEHASLFASCVIRKSTGKEIFRGLLDKEKPITFKAGKGLTYYIYFPARPGTSMDITITGKLASTVSTNKGIIAKKHNNPVYIHVPYKNDDKIVFARQSSESEVRIIKINQLEPTERLDPQDYE